VQTRYCDVICSCLKYMANFFVEDKVQTEASLLKIKIKIGA